MNIDILNLKPTTISRDLREKYILIYSEPKAGKTSFAAQAPKNLMLCSERGLNAIADVRAIYITKWTQLKTAVSQLRKDESKEMYDTVTLDTVTLFWDLCVDFICTRHNVDNLSQIAWGRGYAEASEEFGSTLRRITMLGYGLILIAHADKRIEKTDEDGEIEYISPAMNKRAYAIVNQLVDIIGFIDVEFAADGTSKRWLYTRRTPTVMAGSRFPHLPPKIEFGYKQLSEALADAIEKSAQIDNAAVVDFHEDDKVSQRPFEDVVKEARQVWQGFLQSEEPEEKVAEANEIIKSIFGREMKLSSITENQQDLYELVLAEIKKI